MIRLILLLSGVVLISLSGCNTFYATAYPITTVHTGKNDFAAAATFGAGGMNGYVSYAPTKYFFIGGNVHAQAFGGNAISGGPHVGLFYNSADSSFNCSLTGGTIWGESSARFIRVSGTASYHPYFVQLLVCEKVGKKKLGRFGGGIFLDNSVDLNYRGMYYPSSNGPDSLAEVFNAAGIVLFHHRQFARVPALRISTQIALQGIFPDKGSPEPWIVYQPFIFRVGLTYQFHPSFGVESNFMI